MSLATKETLATFIAKRAEIKVLQRIELNQVFDVAYNNNMHVVDNAHGLDEIGFKREHDELVKVWEKQAEINASDINTLDLAINVLRGREAVEKALVSTNL